jgi:hypothetical protein
MIEAMAAVLEEYGDEKSRAVRVGRGAIAGREQLEALMDIKAIIESKLFQGFWQIWNELSREQIARLLEMAREMAKEEPADATGGPE